jgi:hypothetical protein
VRARLEITSDPPGARVYLGKEVKGTTPLPLDVELGSHTLAFEADGYQRKELEVKVPEAMAVAVKATLRKVTSRQLRNKAPAEAAPDPDPAPGRKGSDSGHKGTPYSE